MRTIGLEYLLGAYILFRALPVCPLCPAIRINGMSPGNVQTTRHGMKGKDMTSKEKRDELYKLAQEDVKIISLIRLFDSDNAPWWAFSQLVENESALIELDKVIPSHFDEECIEEAYQAIAHCSWYLDDVVNDSYHEVFGRSFGNVRNLAAAVARRLK